MKKMEKENKGITLIGLIVTIIVLLILSGIVIGMLSNNNIVSRATNTKTDSEIAKEKEIISLGNMQAIANNEDGTLTEFGLQEELNKYVENNKSIEVTEAGESFVIYFSGSRRFYELTNKSEIKEYIPYKDSTPGELAKDDRGQFKIESIEDLVVFSAMVNGGYTNESEGISIPSNVFNGKTVILSTDLDFNNNFSYNNPSTKIYNGYLGISDENIGLKEALTNQDFKGFIPIGLSSGTRYFFGIFDGQGHKIKNIYENTNDAAGGLFSVAKNSTIKNLIISGNIKSNTNCGGILGCGFESGKIENCTNNVNVEGSPTGGILGNGTKWEIHNCINNGIIEGWGRTGGIAAENRGGKIYNCINSNTAEVISKNGNAGGIEGSTTAAYSIVILNSINLGKVKGQNVGGILGGTYDGNNISTISNCFSSNNLEGTNFTGGIGGNISNWYATSKCVFRNNFFLTNSKVTKPIGSLSITENFTGLNGITINEINLLNNYIMSNGDSIDTSGWGKWNLKSDGNPTIDLKVVWNGTEWE